jgi:nickel transport protein
MNSRLLSLLLPFLPGRGSLLAAFLAAAGLLGLAPSSVLAHGLNVFCWVQDGTVQCETSFSHDSPAREAKFEVRPDGSGEVLVSGEADSRGKFGFEIPERARERGWDLRVVCDAGTGHKSSWIVKAQEFLPSKKPGEESRADSTQERDAPASSETGSARRSQDSVPASEVREMLRKTLASELAPVKRELARIREERSGRFRDILGGIGYIVGLAGLALYFKSRGR